MSMMEVWEGVKTITGQRTAEEAPDPGKPQAQIKCVVSRLLKTCAARTGGTTTTDLQPQPADTTRECPPSGTSACTLGSFQFRRRTGSGRHPASFTSSHLKKNRPQDRLQTSQVNGVELRPTRCWCG
ncbi:hypothetical protein L3Q82_021215 [Scortum barcoo]|uniref:Uncharacterized protein n=1 Tax=Scortum barcoo TaxID=214431 RepID=A0ACB8X3T8_9TELE|nr:hypothetical protein L3Q82_021215 [Scortum barcoo]